MPLFFLLLLLSFFAEIIDFELILCTFLRLRMKSCQLKKEKYIGFSPLIHFPLGMFRPARDYDFSMKTKRGGEPCD